MKKSDAVAYFGTQAALARALGLSKGAVSMWGIYVPTNSSYRLELMTGGALKAEPDHAELAAHNPAQ
ncbi:MAG: Cro/CI family transcriptional regulator [Aeromonas sp.]